jgi:predicted metal-binding protein
MPITLTTCISCKSEPIDGGGQALAVRLESGLRSRGLDMALVRQDCLWACSQSCTLLIQGTGRTGYLAGRFEPTEAAAAAILDWAEAYAATADGVVSYRQWPEGIKGHFIARIPAEKGDFT